MTEALENMFEYPITYETNGSRSVLYTSSYPIIATSYFKEF